MYFMLFKRDLDFHTKSQSVTQENNIAQQCIHSDIAIATDVNVSQKKQISLNW